MANLIVILIIVAAALLIGLFMSVRIVKQYEDGVLFPLGRVGGERASPAAPDPVGHFPPAHQGPILFG